MYCINLISLWDENDLIKIILTFKKLFQVFILLNYPKDSKQTYLYINQDPDAYLID